MRPRRRRWIWLGVGALVVATVMTSALTWLIVAYPAQPGPGRGRVREVPLGPGADLAELRLRVGEYGLVRRPRLFALYAWVLGAAGRVRTGQILVRDDMSPRELLQRLAVGFGPTELRITLPEGLTRFAVADRIARWGVCSRADFLAATEDRQLLRALGIEAASAEGYLFPDTYRIRDDTAARALVRRLIRHARTRMDALMQEQASAAPSPTRDLGFGLHEVVTLASVVEEEAAQAEEQPIIAGVFLNRLTDPTFRPRRLQADPTVAYGCKLQPGLPSCQSFDGRRVTRRMTSDPANPYNTYRHDGLPPGPIASPGLSALRAVLAPAEHRYFYFVARGQGRHAFSETLEDHNRAVQARRAGR